MFDGFSSNVSNNWIYYWNLHHNDVVVTIFNIDVWWASGSSLSRIGQHQRGWHSIMQMRENPRTANAASNGVISGLHPAVRVPSPCRMDCADRLFHINMHLHFKRSSAFSQARSIQAFLHICSLIRVIYIVNVLSFNYCVHLKTKFQLDSTLCYA